MDAAPGRRIIDAVVGEVVSTAAAHGHADDRQRIGLKISNALANHRSHKASMLQDRPAGRRTEFETINGAVVCAAAAVGVATPVTAALADLIPLIEIPGATSSLPKSPAMAALATIAGTPWQVVQPGGQIRLIARYCDSDIATDDTATTIRLTSDFVKAIAVSAATRINSTDPAI